MIRLLLDGFLIGCVPEEFSVVGSGLLEEIMVS
jgi:hypothetical protein